MEQSTWSYCFLRARTEHTKQLLIRSTRSRAHRAAAFVHVEQHSWSTWSTWSLGAHVAEHLDQLLFRSTASSSTGAYGAAAPPQQMERSQWSSCSLRAPRASLLEYRKQLTPRTDGEENMQQFSSVLRPIVDLSWSRWSSCFLGARRATLLEHISSYVPGACASRKQKCALLFLLQERNSSTCSIQCAPGVLLLQVLRRAAISSRLCQISKYGIMALT